MRSGSAGSSRRRSTVRPPAVSPRTATNRMYEGTFGENTPQA